MSTLLVVIFMCRQEPEAVVADPVSAPHHALPPPRLARSRAARMLWVAAGSLALALGVLGIFVRGILPTTPFLLLAAFCYSRGSLRLYRWIYGHRVFGPILLDWEQERSIALRTKAIGISAAWIGILGSLTLLHFTAPPSAYPYLVVVLLVVATGVTLFLSTRKTSIPHSLGAQHAAAADLHAYQRSRQLGVGALGLGAAGFMIVFRIVEPARYSVGWTAFILGVVGVAALLIALSRRRVVPATATATASATATDRAP